MQKIIPSCIFSRESVLYRPILVISLAFVVIIGNPHQTSAFEGGRKHNDLQIISQRDDNIEQEHIVQGLVTDSTGDPLIGVTVQVKGTKIGTTTDVQGHYKLDAAPNAILVFSHLGYATKEVAINKAGPINVTMEPSSSGLNEVVVVGYGTQKKTDVTAAVDNINTKQIESRATPSVVEALQGVSPNLNITTNATTSSEPGGKLGINIRGVGSLTGDYSPYILVDGVPMDLNSIDPSDVESITVLKDAAAAAIYGSRGAFGVILITTKNGSANKDIKIEYSNNISFSSPMGRPHMENSLKFATAFDQASVNAGLGPNFTPENYDRIRKYMAGEITDETWLMPDSSDWYGNGIWSIAGNGNNDWMYILYNKITVRQKHNVSVSGGGEKTSYFVSAGLWNQPDELKYGDQYYKRYNLTANIVSKATNWLTFNLNTKYVNEKTQYFNTKEGYDRNTFYHDFYRLNTFRPLYLPNGEFSDISDIPSLNGGKIIDYSSEYVLSLGATFEPVRDWETVITYNYTDQNGRYDNNQETVYGTNPRGEKYVHAYPTSSYTTNFNNENNTLFNIVSSYQKALKDHNFYIMAGFERQSDVFNSLNGKKNDILTPGVPSISTSTGTFYLEDSKLHWATESFFGRFRYRFKNKYLFEFNGRYDGSSRFASSSRWGFFPSVSVGYNISKESFWKYLEPYITSFKIRGSWGALGNQEVPNYLYLPTIAMGTNLNWIMGNERPDYVSAPGLISADLTWETITTRNIGFDASFINGKLSLTFDLYNRITSHMFGPAEALPLTLGTTAPQSNNATLQTRGFGLVVGWSDNIGSNLSYNIRATLADNVSTVTKYNNPTKTLSTWYQGEKLGEIWGLHTDGIYQSDADAAKGSDQSLFYPTWGAGDIQYKDLNGDSKITRGNFTADSSGDYSIIGNNSPRFPVGLYGEVEWKGFDFSMFWQGTLKRDYAFQMGDMAFYGFHGNQWWDTNAFYKGDNTTLNYWRSADETNILGSNINAYYPKPYLSEEDFKNKEIQTRYMQNAAYLRLKSLIVGYTLPSNITNKVSISRARIYVSGENLVTITSLTKLIDPEALNSSSYGVAKGHFLRQVYSIGVNVTFK